VYFALHLSTRRCARSRALCELDIAHGISVFYQSRQDEILQSVGSGNPGSNFFAVSMIREAHLRTQWKVQAR
jgi:hypothetical protein